MHLVSETIELQWSAVSSFYNVVEQVFIYFRLLALLGRPFFFVWIDDGGLIRSEAAAHSSRSFGASTSTSQRPIAADRILRSHDEQQAVNQ